MRTPLFQTHEKLLRGANRTGEPNNWCDISVPNELGKEESANTQKESVFVLGEIVDL